MSVIGLDFGSHTSSIALWFEEKDAVEVIADDLGSRTIPSFVGFRAGEVMTGQAAMSQYHKNASNTFEDVRSIILNPEKNLINVPALEKEVSAQEIVSHFFRNIHNQIKQQVGKAVRDCIISLPVVLEESIKQRLYEAAQAGGIRIKCMIQDASSTLIANNFDDPSISSAKVVVIDIGWSKTEIYIYNISSGLFFPVANATSTNVSGKVLVGLLTDHCAKDFLRKTKLPVTDNSKAMMRLRKECEESMKHLSTGQESTIDLDSLCEGCDYSTKISRARFEDLSSIPFLHLKTLVADALTIAKLTPDDVTHVCMTGGLSAMPKAIGTVKGLFPLAVFPRGKFESFETQCIGAALHGKYLFQQGLLDNAPTASPAAVGLSRPLLITATTAADAVTFLPVQTVLPAIKTIRANTAQSKNYFQIIAGGESPAPLGEVVFEVENAIAEVDITISVEVNSSIKIVVRSVDNNLAAELAALVIPAPSLS